MPIKEFPDINLADEHGLLALGGDLEIESLLLAYKSGIFPWPLDEEYLTWFSPPKRAILFFENFKVNNSLKKAIKNTPYEIKINTNFEQVIINCAKAKRPKQNGTWITDEMITAYINLHNAGFADSYEVYIDQKLVGGIYGVRINNLFSAESMFHKTTNASKIALYSLVHDLKYKGFTFIDCQVQNPFLETLGVIEIKRDDYLKILNKAI